MSDKSKEKENDPFYVNSIPLSMWDEWEKVTKPFKEASERKRRKEKKKNK